MGYTLYYWPTLPGRGEFVRLVLAAAGQSWSDAAREASTAGSNPFKAVQQMRGPEAPGVPAFAPPILVDGDTVLAQTANICLYLGMKHGLAPVDPAGLCTANQHMLTLADVVSEAHNTHHPLGTALYYEQQKDAALIAARSFREERLPKWLSYFSRVLDRAGGQGLMGPDLSVVDLYFLGVWQGLHYAFPKRMAELGAKHLDLQSLSERVAGHAGVASYLRSDERMPFNEDGIFRYYPELDA